MPRSNATYRIVRTLPLLAVFACAHPSVRPSTVGKHFVVVVQEEDPDALPKLVSRPVASAPLVNGGETAFSMRDPRYDVETSWQGDCLDVHVARHGLAPLPDFDVHGCVRPDDAAATLAHVEVPAGSPVDVVVWFFG